MPRFSEDRNEEPVSPMFGVFDKQGNADFSMPPQSQKNAPATPRRRKGEQNADKNPEWTQGLRQLYNSVVEEPLPDNFKELLAQLNKGG